MRLKAVSAFILYRFLSRHEMNEHKLQSNTRIASKTLLAEVAVLLAVNGEDHEISHFGSKIIVLEEKRILKAES